MINPSKNNVLPGVSGGESVSFNETDHGLGRKADFLETLAQKAQEQGIDDFTLAPQNKTETSESESGNAIDIPVQRLLLEIWERNLASFYSTEDPAKREAQAMADQAVRDTLKELVSPEAVLFVPPDEFSRVHQELQKLAEHMVKDAQALAGKHSKKLPINEETLKRGLHRDLTARKFRDRHNALFHYPGIRESAPETGIAPVAAIDSQHGSITAAHGRYRGTTS